MATGISYNTFPLINAANSISRDDPESWNLFRHIRRHGQHHTDPESQRPAVCQESPLLSRHVKPRIPFTIGNQIHRTLLNSPINILLLSAPAGIALHLARVNGIAVFVVNFVAIIPLAALLSFATEEIALRTGEIVGGLLNASFGNAVELIVAIIALVKNNVRIVQTSLIGSILSNLLLVMGFCFFFGGLQRQEQHFNLTVAQTAASLLFLAAMSIIIPTVIDSWNNTTKSHQSEVTQISRGISVILLLVYGAYLFFQLKTHAIVLKEESQQAVAQPSIHIKENNKKLTLESGGASIASSSLSSIAPMSNGDQQLSNPAGNQPQVGSANQSDRIGNNDNDDVEEPQLHFLVALFTLAASTAIIAICAEAMVSSIDDLTKGGIMSEEFIGLILLPIVGNAAEHATAVTVAIKNKMDLAVGVAVGSAIQVALLIIPLLVVIGWGMGKEQMSLSFDPFQAVVLFASVLLANYLICDGKSHWLEGMLLVCLYAIVSVGSWFYPH
ncbi:Sodium/calcium exchanger protein-domain-containing protein [Echria macrotheca]|uniref:Sodium/calcium exchanger protein-domain-containing protein n=1 Tax=Echria macrotheca TaxID=438768 RepID=A0AAJ0B9J3_9PEZI|nr:Sodium/calcium exchanger protein-domain-containing protein [Echria macrotheca]